MELILSMAVAFAITVSLMPFFIGYFKYRQIGQTTREEGPLWHELKSGTPTMGGTVFVIAISLTVLLSAYFLRLMNPTTLLLVLTFILFGGIGFVDDFISIFKKQNEGLTARQKFLLQLLFSAVIIGIAIMSNIKLSIPMVFISISHPLILIVFSFLWMTGFSNAVNLTDGLDGLATGLNIIAYSAYFYLALQEENQAIALVSISVVGALIGFLIYNKKPAKIFMGDVGSLALGAGLAAISIFLNNPLSLVIIGVVFVVETLSVILQVWSFKTRGKRIFRMSPIHHHFEMGGWSESKVVYTFWFCGMIAALMALSIFK